MIRRLVLTAVLLAVALPAWGQVDIRPESTVSVANSTCTTGNAHTTLDDDPDAPTNDWCDAVDDATDHDIMIRFDLTGSDLDTTTEIQTFAVYTRRSATGGNDPTISLDAYRGSTCATLVENNGTTTITSDTGQLITDTWTAGVADGSEYRCVSLDCARSGGSTPSRRSCDYDAVEWRAVLVAAGERRFIVVGARRTADGGWETYRGER